MNKVLVTGAAGMLGFEVIETLRGTADVVGVDVGEFDITDCDETLAAVGEIRPSVIVNCAAYTDVDRAEAERELAFAVNARGAGNVGRAAAAIGARVLHVSTDYVFDGTKQNPYREGDEPCPVNAYGESKLAGEREIADSGADWLIVRTAWLYGHNGRNFVETVLRLAEEEERLRIVDDQYGAPTNARDLSVILRELLEHGARGVVNATNSGRASWCEFAREILRVSGRDSVDVEPVASVAFPRPAARPRLSMLSLERLESITGWTPRRWEEALGEYIAER